MHFFISKYPKAIPFQNDFFAGVFKKMKRNIIRGNNSAQLFLSLGTFTMSTPL
ncbi:hypothetical protein HJ01_03483 [Flavobacterium frigoris PS1]|uniref:Uncharacterized protein n=1 Tax=Flavobacterium frigoris (strain PS1) TaxID=1086011 RepID=H7FWD6_FLAFP|nr:hypothetical protein HJ01_03483 [Flavobacterium frigoris PS1]